MSDTVTISKEDLYFLLHHQATSSAYNGGQLDRHFKWASDHRKDEKEYEFDIEKYLERFRKHDVEPTRSTMMVIPMMYDMGWNLTDWQIRVKRILEENGLDDGRLEIPSSCARKAECEGCHRMMFLRQEIYTYTDYIEIELPDGMIDDQQIVYCHECVPKDVYDAEVEHAIRKGYLKLPPAKEFA